MSLAKTRRSPRGTGESGLDFFACLASWREEILVPAAGRAGKICVICGSPTHLGLDIYSLSRPKACQGNKLLRLCSAETIPSSLQEMAWLRLRAIRVSVVKIRAKRTQFTGAVSSPGRADCAKRTQLGGSSSGECATWRAKRSQFAPGQTRRDAGAELPPTRMRQTKPISGERPRPQGQLCKTNPIWRVEQGLGACRTKQSQSAVGARQWARDGKSPCRCRRARFCKTNPISGSWPAGEIPHYSSILLFHHSIRCQACETKPISLTAEWPRTGVWSPAFTRF
jgi:hypothetical protein